MKTDIKTLQSSDFDALSSSVVDRIGLLSATIARLEPTPLNDKIAQDVMLPCFVLLAQFCASVNVSDDDGTAYVQPSEFLADLAELARDGRRLRALNIQVWPDGIWEAFNECEGAPEELDRLREVIDATLLHDGIEANE